MLEQDRFVDGLVLDDRIPRSAVPGGKCEASFHFSKVSFRVFGNPMLVDQLEVVSQPISERCHSLIEISFGFFPERFYGLLQFLILILRIVSLFCSC